MTLRQFVMSELPIVRPDSSVGPPSRRQRLKPMHSFRSHLIALLILGGLGVCLIAVAVIYLPTLNAPHIVHTNLDFQDFAIDPTSTLLATVGTTPHRDVTLPDDIPSLPQARTIQLWQLSNGMPLSTIGTHTDDVLSVTWTDDGKRLASSSRDGHVKIWDAQTGALIKDIPKIAEKRGQDPRPIAATFLRFSPNGRWLPLRLAPKFRSGRVQHGRKSTQLPIY